MKDQINAKIKFRRVQTFCSSICLEDYQEVFSTPVSLPYMTVACDVDEKWRLKLPATTHVNNTARVQTVDKKLILNIIN